MTANEVKGKGMSMIEIETENENENENEEGVEAERQIVIGQGSVSENATGIVIGKENGTEINEKMSGGAHAIDRPQYRYLRVHQATGNESMVGIAINVITISSIIIVGSIRTIVHQKRKDYIRRRWTRRRID